MKLAEWLKEHKGILVSIGADSAYLYMDYIDERTEGTLTRLSQEEYDRKEKELEKTIKRLEGLNDKYKQITIRQKKLAEIAKEEGTGEYVIRKKEKMKVLTKEEIALKKATEKKNLKKKKSELEKYLEKFTNFLEREVLDTYHSITTTATIVIIEGSEHGRFWLRREYLNPDLLKVKEDELFLEILEEEE